MFDFVSAGILVILVLVFGFLAFKTWRAKNALGPIPGCACASSAAWASDASTFTMSSPSAGRAVGR